MTIIYSLLKMVYGLLNVVYSLLRVVYGLLNVDYYLLRANYGVFKWFYRLYLTEWFWADLELHVVLFDF